MRLYLSSFGLGSEAGRLRSLMRTPNALVIANALDNFADQWREFLRSQCAELSGLGIHAKELDLRDHFDAPGGFEERMRDVGLVWVTGGNVFLLRRAMRQSGFDRFIIDRASSDEFVYGGFSAGACVAAPSLRGLELVDTADALAAGYDAEPVWDGLGLVPWSIAPHYESDHAESSDIANVVSYFREHEMRFVTLRDGDVIIASTDEAWGAVKRDR